MQYKEIISVSGLTGLYQMVSSKTSGAIIRSLGDNSTLFASSRIHHFTPIESIEVFTSGDNVKLSAVFKAMQEKESQVKPEDPGAGAEKIRAYFQSVYTDLDKDRVHLSDLKKMLKWYGILQANDLLKFEEPAPETAEKPLEEVKAAPEEEKK